MLNSFLKKTSWILAAILLFLPHTANSYSIDDIVELTDYFDANRCEVCPEGSDWWVGFGYYCKGPQGSRGACWSQGYAARGYFTPDPDWQGWFAGCPKRIGCGRAR